MVNNDLSFYKRQLEAISLENIETSMIADVLIGTWIARFSVSLRIIKDDGRQYESHLFKHLNLILGSRHLRNKSYHPQANRMIE